MFPKPQKRAPRPRKPLRARRPGVRRKVAGPRPSDALAFPKPRREKKTSHARRERESGFMLFAKARGCELQLDRDAQVAIGYRHPTGRPRVVEFAHLADERRYAAGDVGAGLCKACHTGLDGRLGGKIHGYAVLDRPGQRAFRMRLANRARAAWDALTPEDRADWDERARSRVISSP